MDPIKTEKLQAMDGYKGNQCHSFLRTLVRCTLRALLFGVFLSCPLWLPKLLSSIKYLLFVVLPGIRSVIVQPKCVFVICNVIIIFILGESMLSTDKGSTTPDIYEEYVEMKKRLQMAPQNISGEMMEAMQVQVVEEGKVGEVKQEKAPAAIGFEEQKVVGEETAKDEDIEEVKEAVLEEEEEVVPEEDKEKKGDQGETTLELECYGEGEDKIGVDEDTGMPADELNRRVEAFIAMFNEQRRMEARMLMCRA